MADELNEDVNTLPPEASTDPALSTPEGGSGATVDPQLLDMAKQIVAEQQQQEQQAGAQRRQAKGFNQKLEDVKTAAGVGMLKAGFELKDFVLGDTPKDQRSRFRSFYEDLGERLEAESPINGIARSTTQFLTGFIGLGKLKWGYQFGTKAGRAVWEIARGATVGATMFDPHEERLSNFIQQFPALNNPVTQFLAAKPEDTRAMGRLKAALESTGMDLALVGAFALSLKAIRYARHGNTEAAVATQAQVEKQYNKVVQHEDSIYGPNAVTPPPQSAPAASNLADTLDTPPQKFEGGTKPFPGDTPDAPPVTGPARTGDNATDIPPAGPKSEQPAPAGVRGASGADEVVQLPETIVEPAPRLDASPAGVRDEPPVASPLARPLIEVTPEQVGDSLEWLRRDAENLLKYGSELNAVDNGVKFNRSELIPYQKLATTEEVTNFLEMAIKQNEAKITKMKGGNAEGVLTDDAVRRLVDARVKLFNEDPAAIIALLQTAGKNAKTMVANMETGWLLTSKSFSEAYHLAQRIQAQNYTGFGSRAEALEGLRQRMMVSSELFAISRQMASAAGRTLRRMRSEFAPNLAQMGNLKAIDPQVLADMIAGTGGNPAAMAQIARPGIVAQATDLAGSLYASNLLWGWQTHAVNLASSLAMTAFRPLSKAIGAGVMQAKGVLTRNQAATAEAIALRTQARREVVYMASNLMDSFKTMSEAFMRGDSILAPHQTEAFTVGARSTPGNLATGEVAAAYRPMNTLSDVMYNGMVAALQLTHAPLRAMGAADELVKVMRYKGLVLAKASTDAEAAGLRPGTQAYKTFLETRLAESFDDAGRAVDPDAIREAKTTTFQNDLPKAGDGDTWGDYNSLGAMWQQGVSSMPWLRIITPFVKTPSNLIRYGVKLTPGLNLIQKEYLNAIRGLKGPEEQAQAIGQMVLGGIIASVAVTMRLNGQITGAGPADPKQNSEWRRQGNRPYALTGKDANGKRWWFDLSRFDPIQMPFTMIADYIDILTQSKVNDEDEATMASAITLVLAHQLKNKTYLQNISEALKAFTDDNAMQSFPAKIAPGFLPFSALFKSVNPDPVQRELRGWFDTWLARIPGASDDLPPVRDAFGEIVTVPNVFLNRGKEVSYLGQALDQMYALTGSYITKASPRLGPEVDLRDITLAKDGRNAYDRYQELIRQPKPGMPTLREALERVARKPEFIAAPAVASISDPGSKWSLLNRVVQQYRDAAKKRLLSENEDLRILYHRRTIEMEAAAKLGKKDLKAAKAQGTTEALNTFLRQYGVEMPLPPSIPTK